MSESRPVAAPANARWWGCEHSCLGMNQTAVDVIARHGNQPTINTTPALPTARRCCSASSACTLLLAAASHRAACHRCAQPGHRCCGEASLPRCRSQFGLISSTRWDPDACDHQLNASAPGLHTGCPACAHPQPVHTWAGRPTRKSGTPRHRSDNPTATSRPTGSPGGLI